MPQTKKQRHTTKTIRRQVALDSKMVCARMIWSVSVIARESNNFGWSDDDFGKPVAIAIINTWSELNTCHGHFPERAADIKRGVWQAAVCTLILIIVGIIKDRIGEESNIKIGRRICGFAFAVRAALVIIATKTPRHYARASLPKGN